MGASLQTLPLQDAQVSIISDSFDFLFMDILMVNCTLFICWAIIYLYKENFREQEDTSFSVNKIPNIILN
jgi:hypothetical protein